MQETFTVDPVPETARKMPLAGNTSPCQFPGRKEQRFGRNDIVLAAVDQENWREFAGRIRRDGLILLFGYDKLAGIAENSRWRPRAPQSGMESEHRPLAEADQSQLAAIEAVPVEFGIE